MGIDLGTQGVRALAVSRGGDVLGAGASKLTSHRDGRRHEQDAREWWEAVSSACTAALRHLDRPSVGGVAVDATSGTLLLVDDDGRPLTPALMYDDCRAAAQVDWVNEVGGQVWDELGYRRMQPTWALPKLLWLLAEYPEIVARARLAHQSDVITRALVGSTVPVDLSNALKTGAHLIHETWPEQVMDALNVPPHVLPALVRSGTPIGTVCAQAAVMTGLPQGTPVIAGATDGCAAQLGAGGLAVGSWNSVLGTTLVLKGVTADLLRDPSGVVYSHKAPDGNWLPGGASGVGAGAISRWFADRDLDDLGARAARHEPAGVLAYPLASSGGERFPFVAPDAQAFVVGTPSDDGELYAAILQGVAYVERLSFDQLRLLGAPLDGDLVFTGGATRSGYWCQLRADILGRPVKLPVNAEPAMGMAILAATPGHIPAEVAAQMVQIRTAIEPRTEMVSRFDESYLRMITEFEKRGWLR